MGVTMTPRQQKQALDVLVDTLAKVRRLKENAEWWLHECEKNAEWHERHLAAMTMQRPGGAA